MPCWSVVTTNAVELNVADLDIMHEALKRAFKDVRRNGNTFVFTAADGRSVVTMRDGKLESTMDEKSLGALAQNLNLAYTTEVAEQMAKRFGWAIKRDAKNPRKFQMVK